MNCPENNNNNNNNNITNNNNYYDDEDFASFCYLPGIVSHKNTRYHKVCTRA